MSDARAQRRAAVRVAVLGYLARHPRGADALAGICAWWLPEEGVVEDHELVDEVLEELVSQGLIRRFELVDGTVVYAGRAEARSADDEGA